MEICSRFTGMERKNGAFLLHTDNADVKVCFVTDEIVRVRASFDHELAEESYVLMTTAWEDRIKLLPDAALYRSTRIHHTPDSYTKRELVGAGPPSILLRKTVRSLKSPTGAFIAALRFANANLSGRAPPSCLRKTVLSLKSPTGAFIAPLRCANANLFNKVQEKLAKNKKAPARHKAEESYLLTTKLFCGHCGALMFGESGTSRTGEVHRYYNKCATAKKHKGCKKKTVRKQWLKDLVVNQTMQLVKDDAAMESIIAKVMELQNKENTNIPLYEKQLRDAESGIQNMLNAIQAGILTSSTKERLEQLEETKRELEARIAEEKLAKPKVTEEFIRFWLLRFRKLDMSLKDQRQALVDTFINAIYLYDDKVLITFNYKEGTQTVTFGEAAEAASKGNGSDLDCFTAPENAVKSKDFMAFFVLLARSAHFCTSPAHFTKKP